MTPHVVTIHHSACRGDSPPPAVFGNHRAREATSHCLSNVFSSPSKAARPLRTSQPTPLPLPPHLFFLQIPSSFLSLPLSFLLSLLTRAHSISIFLTISFPPLMLHPYSPSQPSPDFPLLVNKPASLPSPCLMLPCCLPISFNFIYLSSPPPFLLSSLLSSFPPLFPQFSLISSSI